MRFYSLIISNAAGQVFQPAAAGGFTLADSGSTFSCLNADGSYNPQALDMELDIPVYPYHTPQGGSVIRFWGIGLQMIGQAANLNGQMFKLYGGMVSGLPLAVPHPPNLIAQGTIYQAFGNWQGTDQTLDLIVNPTLDIEEGIGFTWKPGSSLAAAIQTSLQGALPKYQYAINISANLQPPNAAPQDHICESLSVFAEYINEITMTAGQASVGPDYQGVSIAIDGNTIKVFDGTETPRKVQLAFTDLVGQPTWIGAAQITFPCVLRADISVGDQVTFPKGVASPYALTTSAAAAPNAPARSKSIFQGSFAVQEVHYYGRFRQPDAASWNTTYVATPMGS